MLRVTCHPSALLGVLQDWESVDADRAEVITCYKIPPVSGRVDCVDVGAVCSAWIDSCDLPTELAGGSGPHGCIGQGSGAVWHLLGRLNVIEDLGVGLINSSQELGVSRPVHGDDGRRMHEVDRPVQGVLAFLRDPIDVDGVIM